MRRFFVLIVALFFSIAMFGDRWSDYSPISSTGTEFYLTYPYGNSQSSSSNILNKNYGGLLFYPVTRL